MIWEEIPGFFDYPEVYAAAVESARPGATFVEVGSYCGRSACFMGHKIKQSGKAINFFAVDVGTDIVDGERAGGIFQRNIVACDLVGTVCFLEMASVVAAEEFTDGCIDFCFIDAAHDYQSVTADCKAWWPKMRPGGLMAGHDYLSSEEVGNAVDDFFGVNRGFRQQFRLFNFPHELLIHHACWGKRKT